MKEFLVIDKKLKHYSLYTKSLLASLCEELNTDRIHGRRIKLVLDRLLEREDEIFKSFFNDEKSSLSVQLIRYMDSIGDILHIGNGYYVLPPQRAIELIDKQMIAVSSLKENNSDFLGMGSSIEETPVIKMNIDQYLHRPLFKELFLLYRKKLHVLRDEEMEITNLFKITKNGIYFTDRLSNIKEDKFYILRADRAFSKGIKKEYYLATIQERQWFVSKIDSLSHCFRLLLGLAIEEGFPQKYQINILNSNYSELQVPYFLPQEEHYLLRLFALPEFYKKSRKYFFNNTQIQNVLGVLEHSGLKREED